MKLLICGSRAASPAMLDYAIGCVERAQANGWTVIVGDASGVDAAVVQACERVGVPYTCYGITAQARSGAHQYVRLDVPTFRARDEWMVRQVDVVMAVWNGQSRGTQAVYRYAVQQGRQAWLKRIE